MNEMYNIIKDNFFGIISLLIQWFIAYHIFYLWKKLSFKNKLEHSELIEEQVIKHLWKIHNEWIRRKVYLVNVDNYYTKYPDNSESLFSNYSHIRAELKWLRFDWVEFFAEMPKLLYKCNWKLYKTKKDNCSETIKVFPIWIIPYENIVHFNLDWDDFNTSPLIFCKFKWKVWWRKSYPFFSREPYSRFVYYKENSMYDKSRDPFSFEYTEITEKIYK